MNKISLYNCLCSKENQYHKFNFTVVHVQSQTCFVPGECRDSYHVGGREATDVYTCGLYCRLFTGN